MKNIDNKGFSVIELVVAFSLVAIILFLLLEITIILKSSYYEVGIRSEIHIKEAIIIEKIYDDFNQNIIVSATSCGESCVDFSFTDSTTKRLSINTETNEFTYGSYLTTFEENVDFNSFEVTLNEFPSLLENKINAYLFVSISFTHQHIRDHIFLISGVYQYDKGLNPITTDLVINWNCGATFTDTRDSKVYETVEIDDQCWFAENLRYSTTACLEATWDESAPLNACRLNGGTDWDQDQVLYQWGTAMDGDTEGGQGLCPLGWHVPTDAEVTTLITYVNSIVDYRCDGVSGLIGKAMASSTNWDTSSTNCNVGNNQSTNNTTGFNVKPSGYRNGLGSLSSVGNYGDLWTSTPSSNNAGNLTLGSSNSSYSLNSNSQANGFSVRCLLDL